MPTAIYLEPPGAPLQPGPLHFGTAGDAPDMSALPVPYIVSIDGRAGKTDYKAKFFEPDYVKQVGANYANVGVEDIRSIKSLGQAWAILGQEQRTLAPSNLGNGPNNTPQFNLMQPIPYWNVQIVTPQQLAGYESNYGTLVTQVPAEYVPAGPPNLYLGK
jgi:hypothetical protein